MKKLYFILAALLLVASCKKKDGVLVPVRIHVNDFTITQDTMPSKGGIPDYNNVKAVTLAFYDTDNAEQYKVTQFRSDPTTYTTFGDFSLSLPMGSYNMVVLGYGLGDGEPAITLTSPTSATFGDHTVRETFAAVEPVNITNTSAVELETTLSRKVAKVHVLSTDGRTENAYSVKTTFSAGGKGFNPTTGQALTNTGFYNTVDVTNTPVGNTTGPVSYIFLNSDEQDMTVTIDVLDENGVSISHKVVNDVPLKRNRVTKMRGSLYNTNATTEFVLDQDWITEVEVPF